MSKAMVALRLSINGKHVATAGLPDAHVLAAIVGSVVRTKRVLSKLKGQGHDVAERELDVSLSGRRSREDGTGEDVHWAKANLKPGDTVVIEVVRTESVDAPTPRATRGAPAPSRRPSSTPKRGGRAKAAKPKAKRAPTKKVNR